MESCIGAEYKASGIERHLRVFLEYMQLGNQTAWQHSAFTFLPYMFWYLPFVMSYYISCHASALAASCSRSLLQSLLSSIHPISIPAPSLASKANNDIRVVPTKPPKSLRNANTTHRPTPSSTTSQPSPQPSQKAASRPPRPPQPAKSRIDRRRFKRHQRSSRIRTSHESKLQSG